MTRRPPGLASLLLRLRFSRSKSEFLIGDLVEEYNTGNQSDPWYWRQAASLLWSRLDNRHGEREQVSVTNALHSFWIDLRYALRMLGNNRGMTVGAILAVALGIGVNTGIFTLLNSIALRPLPVRNADRVVSVYQVFRGNSARDVYGAPSLFSYPEYLDYREHNHVFSSLLAYTLEFFSASLGGDKPRHVQGQLASCNYFEVLGVRASLGRGLTEPDCAAPSTAPVVVLGDGLWRSTFDANPSVIGKVISLNRVSLTVVGVAPAGFRGTEPIAVDFWTPITMQSALNPQGDSLASDNLSWLVMMGRLKSGVSVAQARADLSVIAGRIDQRHPGRKTTLAVAVASLLGEPEARGYVVGIGAVILAAVSLVLLIACANVANLLLARASGRRKEIAIRCSVGASRGRLIRQLLTESLLLAVIGGSLGSVVAFWSFDVLVQLILTHLPPGIPSIAFSARPDLHVLGYAVALTLITGIIFGLAPALQASKTDLNTALKDEVSGPGVAGARSWLRNALVVVQVSVCLVLLITAGLLARGLRQAQTVDPGFSMRDVAVMSLDLGQQHYDNVKAAFFQQRLIERIRLRPGVDAVAQANVIPLSFATWGSGIRLEGSNRIQVHYDNVSPGYFPLLAIPIIRGRNFSDDEARNSANVAIVMDATARRLWPNQDPVGKVFSFQGEHSWTLLQVVGVAKNTRTSSLGADDAYFFYFPPSPEHQVEAKLLVRYRSSFAAASKGIREAVGGLDPNVLVDVQSMEDNLEAYRLPSRIVTILSTTLGVLALLLASVGIYGVVSYVVSQRTREIGIRMTLGANAKDVLRLVMRGSMRPIILGLVIGVATCAVVSRILSSLLFGVSPLDPITFVGVPAFLLALALLASYLPARRATRVDPTVALRYE
jgi:macrolide transport system ATP-binding/permease protein